MHSRILSINGMLSRLRRDITQEASASDTSQPPSAGASQNISRSCKSPLYAQVASKNLTEVVKTALTKSLYKQQQQERSKQSLVVYGLQENIHNFNDLRSVFDKLGCTNRIVSHTRIRRQGGTRVKPVKVTVCSSADCGARLPVPHNLKGDAFCALVYI